MKEVRTYSISVDGFSPVVYSARSPAKARMRAYRDYQSCSTKSFGEFLAISSIRRVENPPGVGDRILVCGEPATRLYDKGGGHTVAYLRDDSDVIFCAHHSEVTAQSGKDGGEKR